MNDFLYPKMKLTMEHGFKELTFLDILIKNQNSQIMTDIYLKTADPTPNTSISKVITPPIPHKIHPLHPDT